MDTAVHASACKYIKPRIVTTSYKFIEIRDFVQIVTVLKSQFKIINSNLAKDENVHIFLLE